MPKFTYEVTQVVHYYEPTEATSAAAVLDLIESGTGWDHKRNEVVSDRVRIFDENGKCLIDTHQEPEREPEEDSDDRDA